jgi:hypothetical protein
VVGVWGWLRPTDHPVSFTFSDSLRLGLELAVFRWQFWPSGFVVAILRSDKCTKLAKLLNWLLFTDLGKSRLLYLKGFLFFVGRPRESAAGPAARQRRVQPAVHRQAGLHRVALRRLDCQCGSLRRILAIRPAVGGLALVQDVQSAQRERRLDFANIFLSRKEGF